MADNEPTPLPPLSPDQRRITAELFERANQVIASGNHDYGIQLLLSCCKIDPGNIAFRQALRRTERAKYKNNLRGSRLAFLTSSPARARLKNAKRNRGYREMLEYGEQVLTKNPWDISAQMDMAEAAEALGLLDLAVWILEQARQKDPQDVALNRTLARLFEKRGNLTQAIAMWELVHKVDPRDIEASHKAKDLAATETIQRGQYDQISTEKDGPSALEQRGPVLRRADEATTLQAKIDADPTRSSGHLNLAAYHRRLNQIDQARAALEVGLQASSDRFQIQVELAELDIEPFRKDLLLIEERLRGEPGNEELRQHRQGLLKEITSRELEIYRMKADRLPMELTHRLELGIRLLRLGQVDEAIKELQSAKPDGRLAWKALFYLGHCFKQRNNWKLARRNWEEALQVLPPAEGNARKELLYALASGCAEANELTAALELGHELANLDFGYRNIGQLVDEWQARLQQA
jgi:tetratricopeptide (TPR) repeat protein